MCNTCSRRGLLLGAGLAVLGTTTTAGAAKAQTECGPSTSKLPSSCSWHGAGMEDFQVFSTSGRKQIDKAMIAELRRILTILPINPGFKYINDQNPNAFADAKDTVPNTTGTVYIGLNLINGEFEQADGGVAVAGICAHECGHIYQFYNGWMDKLASDTARLVELHADFLAGYYFGRTGLHSANKVKVFGNSLFSKGDYNFNDKDHHGTPEERLTAMQRGYETGTQGVSIEAAAEVGADYVSNQ